MALIADSCRLRIEELNLPVDVCGRIDISVRAIGYHVAILALGKRRMRRSGHRFRWLGAVDVTRCAAQPAVDFRSPRPRFRSSIERMAVDVGA